MKKPNRFHAYWQKVQRVPLKFWFIGGGVFVALLLLTTFLLPRNVTFSYAGATCANQLFFAPDLQKQSGSTAVDVSLEGGFSIGSFKVASTKVCVKPGESFAEGEHTALMSPTGNWLFAKRIQVDVPEAPGVAARALAKKEISAVRPLEVTLASADTIYAYSLTRGEASAPCTAKQEKLSCAVADLDLDHGQEYDLRLTRRVKDITPVETVADFAVTTLTPVEVTAVSVENEQTVYDTVKEIAFTTDKPLSAAKAQLVRQDGDAKVSIDTTATVDGVNGKVALKEDLPRKATYLLTITELEGEDGSSLAEPLTRTFTTSGGPKVTGVSIGAGSVPQNARIIVNFDQAIDDSVDLAKYVKLGGIPAGVSRQSPTQVALTIQNAPLCASFTITVEKGMKSGSNGTEADENWQFGSRVVCGTSSVIGYSVRGRPIIAYYFGSGATTILFTGGIHGMEPSSTTTMQAWVTHLQANAHTLPANKRIVVVPNTNPDGIATNSRNNANNVNLGRNFPTANWSASIQTASGTLPTGGGTAPGSEPETKALIALTKQLKPRLEVSFHAQGSLVGANKFGDSVSIGNMYASTVRYATMFDNAEAVMGYPMTGEYEDWMGESMGIPAILIELPTHSGNYLQSQLTALMKIVNL